MPELPEVEHFRRLLLPLVSKDEVLTLKMLGENHNKKFMTAAEVKQLNSEKLACQRIERRGKLICMILVPEAKKATDENTRFLYVHMGMTGRITTPERVPCFGHVDSKMEAPDEYPPRFSYLQFSTDSGKKACFSDPRKFGYISLVETKKEMDSLAPDALTEASSVPEDVWCNRSTAIKSVMLDQKKVVSGIGNWVADEVLYQAELHPQQNFLTVEESRRVQATIKSVLETACSTSDTNSPYPEDWLFHVRWGKGKNTDAKDAKGRTIKHIDAAGRTSAIVPAIQILRKQGRGPVGGGSENGCKQKVVRAKKTSAKTTKVKQEATANRKTNAKRKIATAATKANSSKRVKAIKEEVPPPRKGVRRSMRTRQSSS